MKTVDILDQALVARKPVHPATRLRTFFTETSSQKPYSEKLRCCFRYLWKALFYLLFPDRGKPAQPAMCRDYASNTRGGTGSATSQAEQTHQEARENNLKPQCDRGRRGNDYPQGTGKVQRSEAAGAPSVHRVNGSQQSARDEDRSYGDPFFKCEDAEESFEQSVLGE